jgi:hypothetical protein
MPSEEDAPPRAGSPIWDPDDIHLFPPAGAGMTFNLYWLVHPLRFLRLLSSRR